VIPELQAISVTSAHKRKHNTNKYALQANELRDTKYYRNKDNKTIKEICRRN